MIRNIVTNSAITFILILSGAGCGAFQAAPAPAATQTPTACPYTQNPGPPPPEVVKRAQEAFSNLRGAGISGKLIVEADGEYSCNQFAVEFVNFIYTITVNDLEDKTALRAIVSRLKDSAKNSVQGWNLGEVTIRFVMGKECLWEDLQDACNPIVPLDYR